MYEPVDVWLPARFSDAQRTQPGRSLRTLALLKSGVTVEQASSELKQLSDCLEPGQAFTLGSGVVPGIPAAPNFLTPVDPIPMIGNDNCKYDRHAPQVYLDPAAFPGVPNGGVPYLQNEQNFGTLELNYDIRPDLSLTSTTAYYNLKSSSSVNPLRLRAEMATAPG